VPEDFHRRLKTRAAARGQSLSDYVLEELQIAADRPTMREWLAAVDRLPEQGRTPMPAADAIAAERARR
jgi:plasmid stability protein